MIVAIFMGKCSERVDAVPLIGRRSASAARILPAGIQVAS
jgi:hypothetical protein